MGIKERAVKGLFATSLILANAECASPDSASTQMVQALVSGDISRVVDLSLPDLQANYRAQNNRDILEGNMRLLSACRGVNFKTARTEKRDDGSTGVFVAFDNACLRNANGKTATLYISIYSLNGKYYLGSFYPQ